MLEDFEELFVEVQAHALTEVIENATAAIEKERQIGHINRGKVNSQMVELDSLPEELVLIGDIHGDLQSLLWVLKDIDFETRLTNPKNKLIFLGDYVDRGSNSIGVLYVICYLKQKFPNSVVLMRGNHEAPVEFPFSSHDLPLKLAQKYGHKMAESIYGNKIIPFTEVYQQGTICYYRNVAKMVLDLLFKTRSSVVLLWRKYCGMTQWNILAMGWIGSIPGEAMVSILG